MAVLLAVAAIWLEGYRVTFLESLLILLSVLLVSLLSAFALYRRQKKFLALNFWVSDSQVTVKRNSLIDTFPKQNLVVGDIILIQEGDIIPVDCLLSSGSVLVNEEHFTSSSEGVRKTQDNPFLISGSKVVRGTCEALVCAVGENRQTFNKLNIDETVETKLQCKLGEVSANIGLAGIYIALTVFVALIGHKVVTKILLGEEFIVLDTIKLFTEYLGVAVVIVIVAAPEGHPLALSTAWNTALWSMQDIELKSVDCILKYVRRLREVCELQPHVHRQKHRAHRKQASNQGVLRGGPVLGRCGGKQDLSGSQGADRRRSLREHDGAGCGRPRRKREGEKGKLRWR